MEEVHHGAYNLEQQAPARTVCHLDVDYNSVNPEKTDFGSFVVPYEDSPLEHILAGKHYEVISRSRLMLGEEPGTNFNVIGALQPGQRVAAKPYNEHWTSIDVEGDGLIDGFVASAYPKEIV